MLNHFIRGYFDGDGCISISLDKYISFVSGSPNILNQMADLFFNLGIRVRNKSGKPKIGLEGKSLCYYGKNAHKILLWMYNNSSDENRLNRKYLRFLDYFPE